MIDGVANDVRQRILDRFDNRLIELHFFSFHLMALFRRLGCAMLQPRQCLDQFLVVALALTAAHVDALQHLPDRVDHLQQRSGDPRR